MNSVITPNDVSGATDAERIQNAIALAKEQKVDCITIPKHNDATDADLWVIDKTVSLPSDLTVFLEGAHLMLADGVYCNLFATENYLKGVASDQRNIRLIGSDGAILDGGRYNGLSEKNYREKGIPIFNNTTVVFCRVNGLEVRSLKVQNQRWWGITNIAVSNAVYRDIEFCADLSRVDENGVHHPDEIPHDYWETYVKNADGIDFRMGCHDITVENISGFTEDDTVALTALGRFETQFLLPGEDRSICNISIKNVTSDCYYCANVRLLAGDGNAIHHITIDHVHDTRERTEYRCGAAVKIGDPGYRKEPTPPELMHHITVTDIFSKGDSAVTVCGGLQDSELSDLRGEHQRFSIFEFAKLERVNITL